MKKALWLARLEASQLARAIPPGIALPVVVALATNKYISARKPTKAWKAGKQKRS